MHFLVHKCTKIKRIILSANQKMVGSGLSSGGPSEAGKAKAGPRIIPGKKLQHLLFNRRQRSFVTVEPGPGRKGPSVYRLNTYREEPLKVPTIHYTESGGLVRSNRNYYVRETETAVSIDDFWQGHRRDRNIDQLKRRLYAASLLMITTGIINHDFVRGLALTAKGYFRLAKALFSRYIHTIESTCTLGRRILDSLLSMISRLNAVHVVNTLWCHYGYPNKDIPYGQTVRLAHLV